MDVRNKISRQFQRTRQLLSDALMTLMLEKPYSAITVQEIADRANVGRSTFYAHYQDKDDLLPSELGRLIEELRQIDSEANDGNTLLPSLGLFRHVQQHYPLYKAALIWPRGLDVISKTAQVLLSRNIEKQLETMLADQQKPSIPLPVLSDYMAATFVTLLKWWLDNKLASSPERMDEIFKQLVMPGLQAALSRKL